MNQTIRKETTTIPKQLSELNYYFFLSILDYAIGLAKTANPTFFKFYLTEKESYMTLTLYENTFITLDEADAYFNGRPHSELWQNLSNTEKEQALIFATIKINSKNFIGSKLSNEQPLEFPRDFYPQLPTEIQYAVCEEALAIVENSVHAKNKELGISSMTLGSSSVSYKNTDSLDIIISPQAAAFLSKWTAKSFNMN